MRHSGNGRVGAVVIGGDYQGLGIVQSLGRQGAPVCVFDDEVSIARFSRYATHAVKLPELQNEEQTVDDLLREARRLSLEGWVLFPTRDDTVATISRHRARLARFFRTPTPEWSAIRWVWDKRNTYNLARKLQIPIPSTEQPGSLEALRDLDVSFPAVIKPAIKDRFLRATKVKAWRANNRLELEHYFRRAAGLIDPAEVMVQELIPGDGGHQFSYCAFFKHGRAMGGMEARRTRQHPYEFGRASTFVETVHLPRLEALSTRFLKAIDYYGLVEMEYKLDPRDGEYKLLDVNARTWGYHTLGRHAGVDFPWLLFSDQVGRAVDPGRARSGVSWVRLLTDLPTGVAGILSGKLKLKPYVDSLRSAHVEAVFSLEDPWPGLAELALIPYLSVRRGY